LPFCGIRWVEDQKVADRSWEVWPNIVEIMTFWRNLPESKQPSSTSFEAVRKGVEDPLTITRISFFSFFASLFHQSKVPILPFLYTDISRLLRSLLTPIVKEDGLQACSFGLH